MKNASTSSTKGVSWPHPCKGAKEGYNQVGGESHSSVSPSQFCGPTKGNRDLPIDRTAGASQGQYSGK